MVEKKYFIILLCAFLASLTYGLFIWWGNASEVIDILLKLPLSTWGFAIAFSLANYLIRYYRWQFILKKVTDIHFSSHGTHFISYIAGFAFTATPGKAGEVLRGNFLVPLGVSYQTTIAAVMFERVLDLAAVVLLAGLVLISFLQYWPILLSGVIGVLSIILFIKSKIMLKTLFAVFDKIENPGIKKIAGKIEEAFKIAGVFMGRSGLGYGLLLGLVAWGFEGISLYLIVNAFGGGIDLPVAIGVYAISMFAGAISFLPGGIGGAEVTMIFFLTALKCSSSVALAVTLVSRLTTLWFAVLIGCVANFYLIQKSSKEEIY